MEHQKWRGQRSKWHSLQWLCVLGYSCQTWKIEQVSNLMIASCNHTFKTQWTEDLVLCHHFECPERALSTNHKTSLIPRCGGRGERVPGTHCLCMHGILWRPCSYVHVCICHKLAALMCYFVWSWSSVRVSFILHCSMPYSRWIPLDKHQERTGCLQWVCLPRKHAFMRSFTN